MCLPDSHVAIISQRHLPIARAEFTIAPLRRFPPLREGNRTRVRFPLLAGGTLRRGFSVALVFINFAHAVGITRALRKGSVVNARQPDAPSKRGSSAASDAAPVSSYPERCIQRDE